MTTHSATAAVVVAGGSGERFERPEGKQLAPVAGWPVLCWSLRALDAAWQIGLIVVVCPADRREEYEAEAVTPLGLATPVAFAVAGSTRQESVLSGLAAVPREMTVVVVHDGARPLVTPDLITGTIEALERSGADGAIAGHPSYDTLKLVESGVVVETADRERYWAVQTPQAFKRSALENAHQAAVADGFVGTDDASLVERAGGRVVVVQGPRDNLKVTVPEDLAYVQAVLNHRREGLS
ncbi:MAG TPA: 2-C-methyl-D-erythritol 4-phosphate cytidylyltransferase [Coriobacteriia bacterium]|nr:2-C-methyl-D-erythritol 4-phosphate cytidylyltransferase [Coriobacteriia bacterium]